MDNHDHKLEQIIREIFEHNLSDLHEKLQQTFLNCLNNTFINGLNLTLFEEAENTKNITRRNEIILSTHRQLIKQVCFNCLFNTNFI